MIVDSIDGEPLPVLFVRGWTDSAGNPDIQLTMLDGRVVAPECLYRVKRPDVLAAGASTNAFAGFVAEFHLSGAPASVLAAEKTYIVPNPERFGAISPHYAELLSSERIYGRDDIYGAGLPVDCNPDVLALARALEGPVLDFGCGNGDLITRLRAEGVEARGVELDRPEIRTALKPEAAPFVTLYDGGLPLPFEDGAFRSAISTEVLEHIEGAPAYAEELARVAREKLLVTVPDMASIPLSFPIGMVPWHLLESTHVNFFTTRSLVKMFAPWFRPERFLRIDNIDVNERFIPGSLVVYFNRLP